MGFSRHTMTMASNGRIVIPAQMRAELGLRGGEKLVARIVDGALMVEPLEAAVRRAQGLVRKYARAGDGGVVDELIAERRAAAARE